MTVYFERIAVNGQELDVAFHEPAHVRAWVVTLHGLESNKDGRKYFALSERLDQHGIGVVRFDFRGCGQSDGLFEDTNVGTRVADARTVLEAVRKRQGGDRLGLFGSSMGGFVSFFVAGDAEVRATVALAAPGNLDDLMEAHADTVDGLKAFLEEYRQGQYRKLPDNLPNVLLLHGAADDVVPVAHVEQVWPHLDEGRRQRIFPGCDHRFSALEDLDEAIRESEEWFVRHLLG